MAAIAVMLGVGVIIVAALLRPGALLPPPVPVALAQWGPTGRLVEGAAVDRTALILSFRAGAGSSAAVPQVEVAPLGRPFTGRVSASGRAIPPGTRAAVARVALGGLRDGVAYRWRARLRGQDGHASRWVPFGPAHSGSAAFVVDLTPPPAPALASPSDPDSGTWYTSPLAAITWPAPRDAAGIAGYAYRLDRDPGGVPPAQLMTSRPGLRLRLPSDGRWYVHVRARDGAGNWGAAASYVLHVDLHPPAIGGVRFASLTFDPDVEREQVALTLANPAHVREQIMEQDTAAWIRTIDLGRLSGRVTVAWDGRDGAGRLAPEGFYRFLITATDRFGRQAVADYSDISLLRRRVVVSLSRQRMVAYEGSRAVASTLVTTGNKLLPTPLGIFHVILKRHPFTFISPWPPGSPLYYPPSPVQYALLFDWRGYFIHDAPWRSRFGPGSNAQAGRPGQNLTGTHGCVNVPPGVAAWLYDWAPVGTTVQVIP